MFHKKNPIIICFVAFMSILLVFSSSVVLADPSSTQDSRISEKKLKLKVAIGRFSNETNYGISLLRDNELDPLGKQAADILTAYTHPTPEPENSGMILFGSYP